MSDFGPKMRRLNERQRAFVVEYIERGSDNYSQAYVAAGYETTNSNSLAAAACRLAHLPHVREAILEETGNRLHALAPVALKRVLEIAMDKGHKDSFNAAKHILSATGFNPKQTIDVHHAGTVEMSFAEVSAQIQALKRAGLQQLPSPVTIDAESVEVE